MAKFMAAKRIARLAGMTAAMIAVPAVAQEASAPQAAE